MQNSTRPLWLRGVIDGGKQSARATVARRAIAAYEDEVIVPRAADRDAKSAQRNTRDTGFAADPDVGNPPAALIRDDGESRTEVPVQVDRQQGHARQRRTRSSASGKRPKQPPPPE